MDKFGKEFAVPKTNDYNILKNFLKNELLKGMNKYYLQEIPTTEESNTSFGSLLDKISIKEPDLENTPQPVSITEEKKNMEFNIKELDSNNIIILIGAIIFILSIIEVLLLNSGVGIVTLFLGLIILIFGSLDRKSVV